MPDPKSVVKLKPLSKKAQKEAAQVVPAGPVFQRMNIADRVNVWFDEHTCQGIGDVRGLVTADALLANGAKSVSAYVTHGVLSGPAIERVSKSKLSSLVVTDSISPTDATKNCKNIRILSVAPLLAEGIRRISEESSVSSLFE